MNQAGVTVALYAQSPAKLYGLDVEPLLAIVFPNASKSCFAVAVSELLVSGDRHAYLRRKGKM
ncbi:MAG: hypothetical protein KGJ62_15505 [Armatimonadetes bacterium]|nr:hypothetical protein [Armatimonadota bacterium]MDE2206992.1 hypothetical protein [Armatimonadota bacterium]